MSKKVESVKVRILKSFEPCLDKREGVIWQVACSCHNRDGYLVMNDMLKLKIEKLLTHTPLDVIITRQKEPNVIVRHIGKCHYDVSL